MMDTTYSNYKLAHRANPNPNSTYAGPVQSWKQNKKERAKKVAQFRSEKDKENYLILKQYEAECEARSRLINVSNIPTKGLKNPNIKGKLSNKGFKDHIINKLRDRKYEIQDASLDIQDVFSGDNMNILESSLLFIYDCCRCRNKVDFVVAAMHLFKSIVKKNVLEFIDIIKDFFSGIENIQVQDGDLFGETFVDFLSKLCGGIRGIFTTEVYSKLKKFLVFIWCLLLKLVPQTCEALPFFDRISVYVNADKVDVSGGYLFDIIDSLIFLIKQGYQSVKTGNLLSFFHSSDTYSKWIDDCMSMPEKEMLLNCVDKSKQISLIDLIKKYDDLIKQGEEMKIMFTGRERKVINIELNNLKVKKIGYYNNILSMKLRRAPLALMISSPPEMGKTTFTKLLQSFYASYKNLSTDNDSRYVRNFQDEYWSNFKTSMWCIILDDIAYENPNKITSLRESSQNEIIQLCNNVAMVLKMAKLEEKGNVACMPQLVLATTNCPLLNAKHLYETPLALLRRFPYVFDLEVKPLYRKEGTRTLDSTKVPEGETDLWNITVRVPIQESNGTLKQKVHLYFDKQCDFFRWYRSIIDEHDIKQDKILAAGTLLDKVEYCFTCYRTKPCDCAIAQDGEIRSAETLTDPNVISTIGIDDIVDEPISLIDMLPENLFSWIRTSGIIPLTPPNLSEYAYLTDSIRIRIKEFCFGWLQGSLMWCNFLSVLFFFICFLGNGIIYYAQLFWVSSMLYWVFYGTNGCFELLYSRIPHWCKRRMYNYFGKLVFTRIYENNAPVIQVAVAFLTTSSLILLLRRMCYGASPEIQGGAVSLPKTEKKNIYYNDVEPSVSSSFGECVSSWKTMPKEEVIDKLKHNVVNLTTSHGSDDKSGVGLFVAGQVVMTNYHLFSWRRKFIIQYHGDGICNTTQVLSVSDSDVMVYPDKDLMFIRFRQLPGRRKIIGLFPKFEIKDLYSLGQILIRRPNQFIISPLKHMCYSGITGVDHPETKRKYVCSSYECDFTGTIKGDCGSPYLAWTPHGPCIIGIHQFLDHKSHCISITQDTVYAGVCALDSDFTGGNLIRDTMPFSVLPLSNHSNLRRIENLDGYIFGSSNRRFPSKSKVIKTDLYDDILPLIGEDRYSAPEMRKRDVWINQIEPIVHKDLSLDLYMLDKAKEMYINEVVEALSNDMLKNVKALPDFENVNGIRGRSFINKINRNTSAGFPLNKSKLNYLTILEDETCIVDPYIWRDVDAIIETYSNGRRVFPVFMGSLKDEIVTKEKAEKNKTRMFTGSPFSWTIVMRRYFLAIVELIENNNLLFESCPGMNALGSEWSNLYAYLTHFGTDRICAGDYSAFDKNMTPAAIIAAFDILIRIAEKAGMDEQDISIMKLIAQDVAFPVIAVDGDLLLANGMNPSGHPLTVIINCLVNCLYLRMAFIDSNPGLQFKEHVHLATYGDDNIFGVSTKCKFNHCILSEYMSKQGIPYTMADKTSESVPFISINEATFLKRKFIFHKALNTIVSQLDINSINKSLLYTIPSRAISAERQLFEKMISAQRELYMHGEKTFNAYSEIFRKKLDELQFEYGDLLSYEKLFEEYSEMLHVSEYAEIQDSVIESSDSDSDNDTCYGCGRHDCIYDDIPFIVCERCKRCRSPNVCVYDPYFYGCIYCESEHPLRCDRCEGDTVDFIVRVSLYASKFFCYECFAQIHPRRVSRPQKGVVHSLVSLIDEQDLAGSLEETRSNLERPHVLNAYSMQDLTISNVPRATHLEKLSGSTTININPMSAHFADSDGNSSQNNQPAINSGATVQNVAEAQVATFLDATAVPKLELPNSPEMMSSLVVDRKSTLGDFLSRPVKIYTYDWSTSDTTDAYFNIAPFNLYFDNANIKYKLHNWAFVRCNLKIKVVFNASPFFYGNYMLAWQPLGGTAYAPYIDSTLTDSAGDHVPLSQLKKVFIEPQTGQSVEMLIPFVYPYDFVPCSSASNLTYLGLLKGRVMSALQSANGSTGSISLSVYAWAEDVVLYGSTAELAMQDGTVDEYQMNGVVSKPATALSRFAQYFESIPVIGPFATATSIGASAVASIAHLFGYTNTPVVDDQQAVQVRAAPFLSVADVGFPIEKLSLDAKNELSIDSRVVGADGVDELAINHLVQKESFLTSFAWTTSGAEDDLLWNCAVTPQLYQAQNVAHDYISMTPMCWLASMFDYWRGDIIFRFKVVSSAFHKGRMRIVFDPLGEASGVVDTQMTNYTKIIDITPNTDVEIRVPYQQAKAWMKTDDIGGLTYANQPYGAVSTNFYSSTYNNGTISCRIQSLLTAPVESSSIEVLVFVRGAENLEFASPNAERYKYTTIGAQIQDGIVMKKADQEKTNVSLEQEILGPVQKPIDHLYLTYMGEQIVSLRSLLRRFCRVGVYQSTTTGASTFGNITSLTLMRMPPRMGYDTNAFYTAKGVIDTVTNYKFNFNFPHLLGIISPAFLGNRGSVFYNIRVDSAYTMDTLLQATRNFGLNQQNIGLTQNYSSSSVSNAIAKQMLTYGLSGSGGMALANKRERDTLSFSVPFYSFAKFAPNTMAATCSSTSNNAIHNDSFRFDISTIQSISVLMGMHVEAAAGTDFNLHYFQFVPTIFNYSSFPAVT